MEGQIAARIAKAWEPYVTSVKTDRVGSVIAVREGQGDAPRRRILLAAHMDEIALMVRQMTAHNGYGFLRVTNVGGVDIRHLYSQLVTVHGRRDLTGVLASLPARMLAEDARDKPYGFNELVVDVGLPAAELEELVDVGDFISFRQPLRDLLGSNVTGKAFDNRASLTAVSCCLEHLSGRSHSWDVVAVATVQEETRLLGAFTSAFAEQPDAAIAIDVTFAKGAGVSSGPGIAELGGGPVLDMGPNVHPGMLAALQETANKLEMDVSLSTHTRGSGTDAFGLQVARAGIPTGLISIPLRYMHTMVETIDTKDVERVGRLLGEFIMTLDDDFVDRLARGMMEDEE
jgi:endoglucanase